MNPSTTTRGAPSPSTASGPLDAVFSKISWRILPLLLMSYVIAYLDRVNIGYAQLQMKQTLPWDTTVYGLGAGIFFIGYFIFEVPSNMFLEKIGARKTLLRIMVCWGIVAAGMMFVQTPTQFYVLRFLLGAFEAGFFPGVILYFTYWYPSVRRGQVIAIFLSATTFASIIAGPLSGATLKYLDGVNGWHGWQWLFLSQGVPAVLLGVLVYLLLDDKPADAKWLSSSEKNLVQHALTHDVKDIESEGEGATHGKMLRDPRIWLLALAYFLMLGATYAIVFWLPMLVQSWGIKDMMQIGLLTAIPSVVGIVGMILMGRHSDKHHERRWHFATAVAIAAGGLGLTSMLQGNLVASLVAMSIASIGISSVTPLFFTLVSEYLAARVAAVGIAMISSLGNLGPAVTPYFNGLILKTTGSNAYALYMILVMYLLSGILLLATVRPARNAPQGAG